MKNKLIFWNSWSFYATYYFDKMTLNIVKPALLATHKYLSMMNVATVYFFHFRFNNAL
jgi:hypothetical protein